MALSQPDRQTVPAPTELDLLPLLRQMVTGIDGPNEWHYFVSASYIEFIGGKRTHKRLYMCLIYVHPDSSKNFDFDDESLLLDTFFSRLPNAVAERIRIPFDQIYSIQKNKAGGVYTDDDRVYCDYSRSRVPKL